MNVEKRDGVTILITEKRLDCLDGPKLKEAVEKLAQESGLRLVLDMATTRFIDSTGLHTLLSLRNIMTMNHGDMKIANLTPKALETFKLVGINGLFQIYDSVESAIESFT